MCYNKKGEILTIKERKDMAIVKVVKPSDQYLKRKFLSWSDAELKYEHLQCLREASLIKAEMKRRNLA